MPCMLLSELIGGSLELPMWLTDGFLVTFFGRWWGAVCIHVSHVQLPYTVYSRVVVGAIYAYMCTYSYRTQCTIHGELTCGGGGNICIHVYLQLPYMVYCTRWTHVWWLGQYMHTCVPTATIHGAPYTVYSRVVVGAIYAYMCTYSYHTRCNIHGAPYMVYSCVVVGAIYAYMCTYSHCAPYMVQCTIHSELTCGGGGNIRIHVYLQLPYTVQHTRCTVHGAPYMVYSCVVVGAIYAYMCTYSYRTRCNIHGVLMCGGGGNIRIHVYLQLLYTVYHTRWTHMWWWGQYTHTCVPTATVHGATYTVHRTRWTHVWRGHSHVGATHVCRGHSRVGVTHVWDEPAKWNSSLLDISLFAGSLETFVMLHWFQTICTFQGKLYLPSNTIFPARHKVEDVSILVQFLWK